MNQQQYGAAIERGRIYAHTEEGYAVESFDRPGLITPPLRAADGASFAQRDCVYFFMFDDGHGAILSAIDR